MDVFIKMPGMSLFCIFIVMLPIFIWFVVVVFLHFLLISNLPVSIQIKKCWSGQTDKHFPKCHSALLIHLWLFTSLLCIFNFPHIWMNCLYKAKRSFIFCQRILVDFFLPVLLLSHLPLCFGLETLFFFVLLFCLSFFLPLCLPATFWLVRLLLWSSVSCPAPPSSEPLSYWALYCSRSIQR